MPPQTAESANLFYVTAIELVSLFLYKQELTDFCLSKSDSYEELSATVMSKEETCAWILSFMMFYLALSSSANSEVCSIK